MTTNNLIAYCAKRAKFEEGYRKEPYICPAGFLTIGYGWNLEAEPVAYSTLLEFVKHGLDRELAAVKMREHLTACIKAAKRYEWFETLSLPRAAAVVDMIYNMGSSRFHKFRNTRRALSQGHWATAAAEILDSAYGSSRLTRKRAMRNSAMVANNELYAVPEGK